MSTLLDKGRERAAAERLAVDFRVADAEALPFADGEFDVAISVFGAMFTPEHARCAAEMARVVLDWLRMHLQTARNQAQWGRDPKLQAWLRQSRPGAHAGVRSCGKGADGGVGRCAAAVVRGAGGGVHANAGAARGGGGRGYSSCCRLTAHSTASSDR